MGASRDAGAPGGAVLRALLEGGRATPVYAVNRAADVVAGRRAYRSLALLPGPVDLVVAAVPAEGVPAVAREAAACGARALVVLSAGFAEQDAHGAELQAELVHVCRTAGVRLVGPNCLGVSVSAGPAPFDATFGPLPARRGRIALASQSGGLGVAALAHCAARGIGTSAFVSLGNGADVAPEDLLAWWDADPDTRAALLYLEGAGDPRRFARIARRVSRATPVVALKGGRGGAGRRAAGSHTAALAGGEPMTEALFDLAGVVRADTLEELLETGEVLASQPLPAGPRLGIVSNAGGPAILAADAAEALGSGGAAVRRRPARAAHVDAHGTRRRRQPGGPRGRRGRRRPGTGGAHDPRLRGGRRPPRPGHAGAQQRPRGDDPGGGGAERTIASPWWAAWWARVRSRPRASRPSPG